MIGLLLIGFAGYKLFIQKDNEPYGNNSPKQLSTEVPQAIGNNQLDDKTITKLEKYDLTQDEQEFTVGNKTVKIKAVDNNVYVDGKETTYYGGSASVYVTNLYIIIAANAQTTNYLSAISHNGEIIKVVGGVPDTPIVAIDDLCLDNGKLMATYKFVDSDNADNNPVEFIYETNQIVVK